MLPRGISGELPQAKHGRAQVQYDVSQVTRQSAEQGRNRHEERSPLQDYLSQYLLFDPSYVRIEYRADVLAAERAMILIQDWHEWVNRLGWASLEWTLAVFLCHMVFSVIVFRRREHSLGIVFAVMGMLCFPGLLLGLVFGLIYGWQKARSWQIRTFMIFWAVATLIVVLNWIGYFFIRVWTVGPD